MRLAVGSDVRVVVAAVRLFAIVVHPRVLLWGTRALACAALVLMLHFTLALLRVDPVIWPDEGLFANPAINLLRHGRFGTDLMNGMLPGIEQRTYWMPPVHGLVAAGSFALFGIGLVSLRVISLAAALAALALTYGTARRAGLRAPAALLGLAFLACDPVFLRAARLGRMDMLAVAFVLAAIYFALAPAVAGGGCSRRAPIAAGMCAALATLTHPLGVAALLAGLSYLLADAPTRRRRALGWFTAGASVVFAPYAVYVLAAPHDFLEQLRLQLARKEARHPGTFAGVGKGLRTIFDQYARGGLNAQAAKVAWGAGFVGLGILAVRLAASRAVLGVALATAALVLVGREMWYPVYAVPFVAIGLSGLIDTLATQQRCRWRVAVVLPLAILGFAVARGIRREDRLAIKWAREPAGLKDYDEYCRRIAADLPTGALVLLDVIPDPYLGLARQRPDLVLRQYPPGDLPTVNGAADRVVRAADYIVTGKWTPHEGPKAWARRYGVLVEDIGAVDGLGFQAVVYRMTPATRLSRAVDPIRP